MLKTRDTLKAARAVWRTLQLNPTNLPNLEPIWFTQISRVAPINQCPKKFLPPKESLFSRRRDQTFPSLGSQMEYPKIKNPLASVTDRSPHGKRTVRRSEGLKTLQEVRANASLW